jgi:hypothetical protein
VTAGTVPAGRCTEMKARGPKRRSEQRVSGNEQVRVEIQTFLAALNSYPERFAVNPGITFEEHCTSLMAFSSMRLAGPRNGSDN